MAQQQMTVESFEADKLTHREKILMLALYDYHKDMLGWRAAALLALLGNVIQYYFN